MKFIALFFSIILLTTINARADVRSYFVVDIERVIYNSEAAVDLKKKLDVIKNKYQAEINEKEKSLKKIDDSLKNDEKTLTKEAFEKKVKDFQFKVSELQRNFQMKRSNLEEANQEALGKITENASKIIEDLAKEKNVELVFPTSQILFAQTSLDMTDEVINRLNKVLNKVELKVK